MESIGNSTLSSVVDFTANRVGVPAGKIGPGTRLLHDLGLDGDDAEDFLMGFQSRFQIDLNGLKFFRYFGGEWPFVFGPFLWVYNWLFYGKTIVKHQLTIQMLCDAVDRKKWEEP